MIICISGATIPATLPQLPKVFQIWLKKTSWRKQEIQKNPRNTSIIYTEEEETDREIYKRCLTPKKNQPRIKPEAFRLPNKLEFLQNLRCSIYWRAAETNLDVFWLRHLTFSFLSNFHIFVWSPPHQNSLQCLSMSRKRNQEPVDISLQAFPFLVFGVFHIFMFWRSSIFHCLQISTWSTETLLLRSRAHLYNRPDWNRCKTHLFYIGCEINYFNVTTLLNIFHPAPLNGQDDWERCGSIMMPGPPKFYVEFNDCLRRRVQL